MAAQLLLSASPVLPAILAPRVSTLTLPWKQTHMTGTLLVRAQMAQALIDSGCDVIGQHADSTACATTHNKMATMSVNADMRDAAPDASLTSAVGLVHLS